MEMTALFDTAGIDLKTHKPVKLKTRGSEALLFRGKTQRCGFLGNKSFGAFTLHMPYY